MWCKHQVQSLIVKMSFNITSDEQWAEKLRRENCDQFNTLVRMHLSFMLDLNTDDTDCVTEKTKLKKWSFVPFVKKSKCASRGVMDGAPLTQEGICQVYQLIEFLGKEPNICAEGIFRRTGSLARQQELRALLNQGKPLILDGGQYSVHDCASVLKGFLAELPEPLLTDAHYPAHCQIADLCYNTDNTQSHTVTSGETRNPSCENRNSGNEGQNPSNETVNTNNEVRNPNNEVRNQAKEIQIPKNEMRIPSNETRLLRSLQLLLLLLPTENRVLLRDVLKLLHETAKHEPKNKMSAESLATLFTPHLLCPRRLTPEALHADSQTLSGIVAFMIRRGVSMFEIPPKLAVDIRSYFSQASNPRGRSPGPVSGLDPATTVYSFLDREKTAHAHATDPTETALAQLYAYIQSLPESSKKRKLVKQFNRQNGNGTPLQQQQMQRLQHTSAQGSAMRSKSLGDSIKRHIFQRNPKREGARMRSASEELLSSPNCVPLGTARTKLFCMDCESTSESDPDDAESKEPLLHKSASLDNDGDHTTCATNPNYKHREKNDGDHSQCLNPNEMETDILNHEDKCGNDDLAPDFALETQETRNEAGNFSARTEQREVNAGSGNGGMGRRATRCFSEPDLSSEGVSESVDTCWMAACTATCLTSTPAVRPLTFTPLSHHGRKSMSPITRSTQKMSRAMQETMMTPRSRKPVLLIYGTNVCGLPKLQSFKRSNSTSSLLEESSFNTSANITSSSISSSANGAVTHLPNFTTTSSGASRGTPVDASFSSRTDDYGYTCSVDSSSALSEGFEGNAADSGKITEADYLDNDENCAGSGRENKDGGEKVNTSEGRYCSYKAEDRNNLRRNLNEGSRSEFSAGGNGRSQKESRERNTTNVSSILKYNYCCSYQISENKNNHNCNITEDNTKSENDYHVQSELNLRRNGGKYNYSYKIDEDRNNQGCNLTGNSRSNFKTEEGEKSTEETKEINELNARSAERHKFSCKRKENRNNPSYNLTEGSRTHERERNETNARSARKRNFINISHKISENNNPRYDLTEENGMDEAESPMSSRKGNEENTPPNLPVKKFGSNKRALSPSEGQRVKKHNPDKRNNHEKRSDETEYNCDKIGGKEPVLKPKQYNSYGEPTIYETSF